MVEGVIVCPTTENYNYDQFKKFRKLGVPLVFYDRVPSNYDTTKIVINDFESVFKTTEHLIKIGCTRIAHIAGTQYTPIFKARLQGYKSAIKKPHGNLDEKLIIPCKTLSYEEGALGAEKFLKFSPMPDGIFCTNDYTAVSVFQVFRKAGIKIPEDTAVVGFSNYTISQVIEPHLTTINYRGFSNGY